MKNFWYFVKNQLKEKPLLDLARQILKLKYEDLIKIKGINSDKACTILASQEFKRTLHVREGNLAKN